MSHTAKVTHIDGMVTMPNTDDDEALAVRTDLPWKDKSAIYLAPGSPVPDVDGAIRFGVHWAKYVSGGVEVTAHKLGLAYDPDEPLR